MRDEAQLRDTHSIKEALLAVHSPFGNDAAKIEGYRAFWQRAYVARPLIGFSLKSWFPLQEFAAKAPKEDPRAEILQRGRR